MITATISLNVTKCQAVYLNICKYHHYYTGNFSSNDYEYYISNVIHKTSLKFEYCDNYKYILNFGLLPGNCAILVLFDKFNPFQRLERNELLITCEIKLSSKWGENKISYIDGVLGDGNYLEVVGHKDCFSSNHLMCNTIFKDRSGSEFHQIIFTKNFKQYLSEEIDVVLVKISSRQTKNLVNTMLTGLSDRKEKKQYGLTAHQPGLDMSDLSVSSATSLS